MQRGAAGIVTDGGVRDSPAFAKIGIPTYYQAPHAAVLGLLHYPLERNVPVSCAGVLVMPGDVVVGDAEGVVILPAAMAEEVAHEAAAQELQEAWALERVQEGESVRTVYPMHDSRRQEFENWKQAREDKT
jgi:regulator of RNase E activity RraA